MPASGDGRPPLAAMVDGPAFSVERFDWGAPDRLVVSGTFSGLAEEPPGEAVLIVMGEDGPRRLPAVEQDGTADGGRWRAEFAWLEAPVAFDHARLELGAALAVELPAPGTVDGDTPLPVVRADGGGADGGEADGGGADGEAPVPRPATDPEGAADRLRLETRLLEEAEELEQERARAIQAEEALARAQGDLAAERERRAADAERFRDGLAMVRGSAEEAVAAAASARAAAEDQAHGEIAALRERVAALEPAGAELESTRAELESVREELDAARGALAAARGSAQELLDRLSDDATGRR